MIVLDTNVISEVMRPRPEPAVQRWLNAQVAETLYLPSIGLAELLFGVAALATGARKARLASLLDTLTAMFAGRVLPFDERAARAYAEMAAAARTAGRELAISDGYIAATASSRGFAVATRNTSDFDAAGVALINPWQRP